jgi:hypothetical protein
MTGILRTMLCAVALCLVVPVEARAREEKSLRWPVAGQCHLAVCRPSRAWRVLPEGLGPACGLWSQFLSA